MKLDMLSDRLDEIHMARKYKRLSTAVVCYHLLVVNFSNKFISYLEFPTYLGDMIVLCTQRIKAFCGDKQKRYLMINLYFDYWCPL
jgi:hypothetical protein